MLHRVLSRWAGRLAGVTTLAAAALLAPSALPADAPDGPAAARTPPGHGGVATRSLPLRTAIQGLDPVRLLDDGEEVAGLEELAVEDGSWRYFFADGAGRRTFERSPARYRIVSGEYCAVMPGVRANPQQWAEYKGRLYAFSTPSARLSFLNENERYLDAEGRLKGWGDALVVAVALYPGFEWSDAGVSELLGVPGREGFFRVRMVASSMAPVPARTTGAVLPDATFEQVPSPDILIVPGGDLDGARADQALMEWLRRAGTGARRILAVNNAPWLIQMAGLLDDREAVINPAVLSSFQAAAPRTRVIPNTRWVESGPVLTAAGSAAGMEAAIKMVGDLRGRFRGVMTARYFGIEWKPEMEPTPKPDAEAGGAAAADGSR